MESLAHDETERECLMIWVRHGERVDNFSIKKLFSSVPSAKFKFDPQLTEEGKL